MRVRVRNRVYLKQDLGAGLLLVQFNKTVEIIKIIIPNHKRVFGDVRSYCVDCLERDSFDNNSFNFILGPGSCIVKIKEIMDGIWRTEVVNGFSLPTGSSAYCYIFEPKSKLYRNQILQEHPEWLTTTN